MNLTDAVKGRRSIRGFEQKPVPEELLKEILALGQLAPSAGNVQPCKFYVVRKEDPKTMLSRAAYGQESVAEAPAVIVVTVQPGLSAEKYQERGRELYALLDAGAAVQTMLLAATERGLGSCWVGAFDEKAVGQILELNPGERPVTMIPLGYPAYTPDVRQLKAFEEVVSFD